MLLSTKLTPLLILFLLHTITADIANKPPEPLTRSVKLKLSDLEKSFQNSTLNPSDLYGSIVVVSSTRPTTVTFKPYDDEDSEFKGYAIVSRTKDVYCTFPALRQEYDDIEMNVYSMEDGIEVLLITNWIGKGLDPSTDMFVVNMKECTYDVKVLPIAVSDVPRHGMGFVVLKPWNNSLFEIFSFDGRRDCGSYICRRVYNIEAKILDRPKKFTWLDNEVNPNMRMIYNFGALEDNRYFALQMLQSEKAKLSYLTERGILVDSTEIYVAQAKFMEMSMLYNKVGICYNIMYKQNEVRCHLLDPIDKFLNEILANQELEYRIESMSVQNLPNGRMMLLTLSCDEPKCDMYMMKLYIVGDGVIELEKVSSDKSCIPKTEFYPTLYKEGDDLCVYYQCIMSKVPPNAVWNKCFGLTKLKI